jgi:broad specificity phosphatase PhoE
VARARPGVVAMVSHAEVIRTLVLDALQRPLNEWTAVTVNPASITILYGSAWPMTVAAMNLRAR